MTSQDFRDYIITNIRGFEKWAWKDSSENPKDYENFDKQKWLDMFNVYLESNDV